jgi:tellurite resistance protein
MELGLLKTMQAALGISEDEVAQIIDIIEQGGSLAEALGEPLERLYAEVMVLVSAADGQLKEAEARALVESFAADPLFHNVSAERALGFVSEAVSALTTEGLPQRLQVLAHGLSTHGQRVKAYRLATKIAHASGKASAAEQRILDLLQATFGLADDEVSRLDEGAGA